MEREKEEEMLSLEKKKEIIYKKRKEEGGAVGVFFIYYYSINSSLPLTLSLNEFVSGDTLLYWFLPNQGFWRTQKFELSCQIGNELFKAA